MKNKNYWLSLVFILLSTTLIFPLLYNNFFITDDFTWVHFARQAKFINVLDINYGHLYNPIINLYFYLTQKIFGLSPQLYYLANVLIHGFNSFLIYTLANIFLKNKKTSFLLGLFFLLQYYGSEAFFWISSVTHLIATAFILLSLILLKKYLDTENKKILLFYYLATILALITKEIAFPLIFIHLIWYLFLIKYFAKKIEFSKILKILAPLAVVWVFYGLIQFKILNQTQTLNHYFNPAIIKQISTIFRSVLNLVLYTAGNYSFLQIILTLVIFIFPLFFFKKNYFLIYLFGIFWLAIFSTLGSLTTSTLISNRYGYIMTTALVFIFISLFKHFENIIKIKNILHTIILLLIIYNYLGIIKTDAKYQEISNTSKKAIITLPKELKSYDNIYILDGYPYDHSIYLSDIMSIYFNQNKIIYIYTDKRNDKTINKNEDYLVLRFDYLKEKWNIYYTPPLTPP
jgi:hypothetical protein